MVLFLIQEHLYQHKVVSLQTQTGHMIMILFLIQCAKRVIYKCYDVILNDINIDKPFSTVGRREL